MAYYGFVLYITNLEGNDYLNVAVAGAVEVPGHFIIMVLAETKLGRRYTYLGVCILTGATVIGSLVTPNCGAIFWVRFALNMIGKSSIAALYSLTFMYTAELVPTSVRSLGVSIMSTFALFGGVLAPQILLARLLWKPLPMIIFAAMPITVGFLVLLQPETKGKKLPQTLEECEQEEKQSPTV
ncbi:organic cation transporter protein-like [Ptychodera flava]|uniref:organic cation transporter protein-like n=1 Tax=Ptychodera flava TaxID=63121 RepID=UPI00396AA716